MCNKSKKNQKKKKSCQRKTATPMVHNKLLAINCIWQVHTVTLQTWDSRMTAGTRGNGERRGTCHWTRIYERVRTEAIHQRRRPGIKRRHVRDAFRRTASDAGRRVVKRRRRQNSLLIGEVRLSGEVAWGCRQRVAALKLTTDISLKHHVPDNIIIN